MYRRGRPSFVPNLSLINQFQSQFFNIYVNITFLISDYLILDFQTNVFCAYEVWDATVVVVVVAVAVVVVTVAAATVVVVVAVAVVVVAVVVVTVAAVGSSNSSSSSSSSNSSSSR